VFAFWAVRQAALKGLSREFDLAAVFQESRDHGLQPECIDRISSEWSPRVSLSREEVKSYLTDNIHYFLDPDCLDGMQLFYRYAPKCEALFCAPPLTFLDVARAVAI